MRLLDWFRGRSRPVILMSSLLTVGLLGFTDYVTGPELFFLEFYLVPVLFAGWFAGETAGVLTSIASGVCWFADEVVGRSAHAQMVIPYWNVAVKLLVFVFLTHMMLIFKAALEREKLAEEERIKREIDIARQVQERLFPQVFPTMDTLDYTGICQPASGVGGDYYDFLQVGIRKLGIVISDISGKGISSALLMASLQGSLRSRAQLRGDSVDALVGDVNQFLHSATDPNKYATLFYCVYDDSTRSLTYVNAGHNPPFLFQSNPGGIVRLQTGGTVIGLFKDRMYQKATVHLHPGDIVALFTDGVTEARNAKDEEFGEERLASIVSTNHHLSASALTQVILSRVHDFVGRATQHDDITLVLLKAL